jgi:hypothetical protein
MPDRYQESHIRRVPLFSQLPPYQFQLVAQSFEVQRYNAGDYILYQNTLVPGLIILVEGTSIWLQAMPDGRGQQLGVMQEGDSVYQEALFSNVAAQAYLQAVRPTTILVLTRQTMANLLAYHPDLKVAFGLERSQDHHIHHVRFESQRENEEVLLETRRHRWAYLRHFWMPSLLTIAVWVLTAFVPSLAIFLILFSLLIFAAFAAYFYLEWANDSVIITSQRVIQITRTILTLRTQQSEINLESIQEVNAQIPSFDIFARIFHYGHIELKTAGSEGNVTLDFIPNPQKVQKLILEDSQRYKQAAQSRERQTMQADINRWINEPYRAGQQAPLQADKPKNAARESKLKNIYNEGEGPLSPFVSAFPSDSGGIVYRKHWIVWLSAVFVPLVWLMGTLTGALVLLLFGLLQTIGPVAWAMVLLMLLISGIWFYYADWDWRHDYYLVNDNSITFIKQRPLWLQNESEQILLKQVDSVTAEVRGIRQRIFHYGNVRVSLVGADDYKLFGDVANPLKVQSEISRRQQAVKQGNIENQQRQQREVIGEYISVYHQQQQQQTEQVNYPPQSGAAYMPQHAPMPQPSPFGNRPPRPSISRGRPYRPQQGYTPPQGQQPYVPSLQQQGYTPPQGQQPYVPSPQQQGYTPPQGQQPYVPSLQQQGYTPPQGQQPYVPSPQQQGYTPPQGQRPYVPSPQQQGYTPPQGQQPYVPSLQQQGYTPPQGQQPFVPSPPKPPDENRRRPPKFGGDKK